MDATKENTVLALLHLASIADCVKPDGPLASDVDYIREFLKQAEKRLPSAAAVERDRARRKKKV